MRSIFWLLMAVVSAAMLAPEIPTAPFELADKVAHFGLFAALAGAARLSDGGRPGAPGVRPTVLFAIAFALAFLLEGMQIVLPNRSADINDLLANVVGVAAGWATAQRIAPAFGRTPLGRWLTAI